MAYAAKTGTLNPPLLILYTGLIFWTVGYDTIYACQDIEDDMKIGVKSTARRFGKRVKLGVGICFGTFIALLIYAFTKSSVMLVEPTNITNPMFPLGIDLFGGVILVTPLAIHLLWQVHKLDHLNSVNTLKIFKANFWTGLILIISMSLFQYFISFKT